MEEQKIWEIVQSYIKKSDFYSSRYAGLEIHGFSDIPLIDKKDLLQDQAQYPPFGKNLCVDRNRIARIHRTSGTSTNPLLLALTKNDLDIVIKAGSAALKTAGMGPGDIVVNCMNYNMWMGGFMDHQSMEATGAAVVPYGVGHTENLINLLLELEGPSLHSTPSYLEVIKRVLAEKFGKSPIELGIKKGFFGGESGMQNPDFRMKIEEEWGMKAMNANYGLSEVISILGAECEQHDGLHFTAESFLHFELVSTDTEVPQVIPLQPGAIGELVVTTLYKEAQPLIRYRIGDIIEVISIEPCKCGASSFRFKVVGRRDDMLVIKGINFYPESIRSIISSYSECSGNYKIQIPNTQPIAQIKVCIQAQGNEQNSKLKETIKQEICNKFSVSPVIELVDEIKVVGNKAKLVEVV
jgi:phenylacetate-CoA ligase